MSDDAPQPRTPHQPSGDHQTTRWVLGFIIATLLVWGLSWPFVDSVMVWQRDDALNGYVPDSHYTYRFHREGWGSTHFEPHGVLGEAIDHAPRLVIWGDSYVEALQVDDGAKLPAQVRSLSGGGISAVAVARSSWRVADYVHAIPLYRPLLSPRAHYVVAAQLADFAVYHDGEGFAFRPTTKTPPLVEARSLVADLELHFAWAAMRTLIGGDEGGVRSLRFALGPTSPEPEAGEGPELSAASIDFAVGQLRAATHAPVTLIFAPCTPTLDAGMIDDRVEHEELVTALSSACRRNQIDFLDLRESFRSFHAKSGRFGCGFDNGTPSRGHYNEDGHRLVAAAIVAHAR